jgi:hypothetical protein
MKLQGLVSSARELWSEVRRSLLPPSTLPPTALAVSTASYAPLQRILLTDGVGRTLFEGYARHRNEERGEEETGWVLLGLREAREAVALATLPAGSRSDAGVAHIQFNSTAQAVGCRIVRQADRRLTTLGIVHTHPGSLRHPSDGDLRGDRVWVQHLRGREGVFAIGTADVAAGDARLFASRPRPNVQCLGDLRFSWYALRQGDAGYRPLPVEVTIGPDLARDLHAVWPTLEAHAERVERLLQQQAGVQIEVVTGKMGPALVLVVPLAGNASSLRVHLQDSEVRYFLQRDGEVSETSQRDDLVDRGVYLLLAELAAS